jgi:acyl-coenzyme A thioesterase PaaI-like protein
LTSEVRERPEVPARLQDPEGEFTFEPHNCFACGELNEHGLHLELHTDPTGSWTELELPQRFQGWESVAHGGIACTILDEVMAWSAIGQGTWGVTARLSVAFRRPIHTRRRIRAEGRVTATNRRATRTSGRILDAGSGEVLATAEGTFMALPERQLALLKARYGMRRARDTTATGDAA